MLVKNRIPIDADAWCVHLIKTKSAFQSKALGRRPMNRLRYTNTLSQCHYRMCLRSADRKFKVCRIHTRRLFRCAARARRQVTPSWMTEMDLLSLQLQRHSSISVTEGAGWDLRSLCFCDLDLDLDILKTYPHTKKINFLSQCFQMLQHCQQTRTRMQSNALSRCIRGWRRPFDSSLAVTYVSYHSIIQCVVLTATRNTETQQCTSTHLSLFAFQPQSYW